MDNQLTIKELIEKYLVYLKVRNYAQRTITGERRYLKRLLNYLEKAGITQIDQITKDIIYNYQVYQYERINSDGKPNKVSSQNNILKIVKQFLKYLKENDYILTDPSAHVDYAKVPKSLPRVIMTKSEIRKILNEPDKRSVIGYRDRAIMEILYSSGIRRSEIVELKLEDVDYHDGFLRINIGKGKKDRVVPIGKIACRYIENYIKSVRPELIKDPYNTYLFLGLTGNKLAVDSPWRIVKKYVKAAKIKKNVSTHSFRHTCATSMLKNNADIRSIQELLGHTSLDSTQVYTRVTITDLKEVHKRCHPRERDKE